MKKFIKIGVIKLDKKKYGQIKGNLSDLIFEITINK